MRARAQPETREPSRSGALVPAACLAVLLAGLCLTGGAGTAAESPPLEYQVKASYLYHFIQFIEWKTEGDLPSDRWIVCVVGRDPFGAAIDALEGERVRERPITVQRKPNWEESGSCHVAFAGGALSTDDYTHLGALRGRPTLTVGETDEFLDRGGIVQFVLEDRRVRFRIDRDSARSAGLHVGAQLLRLGAR